MPFLRLFSQRGRRRRRRRRRKKNKFVRNFYDFLLLRCFHHHLLRLLLLLLLLLLLSHLLPDWEGSKISESHAGHKTQILLSTPTPTPHFHPLICIFRGGAGRPGVVGGGRGFVRPVNNDSIYYANELDQSFRERKRLPSSRSRSN